MMLIYEKRGRRKEDSVIVASFNTVSDRNAIILKCTIYRDVFHSRKSLYASRFYLLGIISPCVFVLSLMYVPLFFFFV